MKMEQILSTVLILLFVDMLAITSNLLPSSVAADYPPRFEVLDEIGTHFELPRFNVSITTDATVHMFLRACSSDLISYVIENASDAMSTQLTLGYLKPFTIYYMFQDGLADEHNFTTDDIGSYSYTQDLSELHHVFIQPESGTLIISQSTTLQSDVHDEIYIVADNVVLDLNGHEVVGSGNYWLGIVVDGVRNNVTIKNGRVRNTLVGIYLDCKNSVISNLTMSSNSWSDIEMSTVWNSLFIGNTFLSHVGLECGWGSTGNKIYHNNFIGSHVGFWGNTKFNEWDNGYPSGGNYWSYYATSDLKNGPSQDILGSDGTSDSPYTLYTNNIDHYPLMNSWTPMETVVKIGNMNEPVTLLSNATIGQIVATKNNLKFTSSGLAGETGYISLILPMVNTTNIGVSIDHKNPALPFPIITTDGTCYFIYFEFALSTHTVTIQFAPAEPATVDVDPNALNLMSQGEWITSYIELAEEYDVNDIDVSTVTLNGTFPAELQPIQVGDYDGDGIVDLMVKLNRTEVSNYVGDVQNIRYGNVTLTIKGELNDGTLFEGSDVVRVRLPWNVNCSAFGRDTSIVSIYYGKTYA